METQKPVSKNKWQDSLIKYLKQNFSKKNNICRLICFAIGVVIVLVPSLTCNLMIRAQNWQWSDNVQYNGGIAFSVLEDNTVAVYVLQSLICVLVFVAILFTDKWYLIILLSMAFAGGMFNVIDRATQYLSPTKYSTYGPDKVIDYLPTFNTLSNFPDVFILTGVIGFSVLYIGVSIYHFIKEKKTKKPGGDKPKNEKNHS